jgi:hypothetical protein
MKHWIIIGTLLASTFGVAACSSKKPDSEKSAGGEVKEGAKDAADAVDEAAEDTGDAVDEAADNATK